MSPSHIKNLGLDFIQTYPWIIVLLIISLFIVGLLFKHRYYYEKKEYLCSRSEQSLYKKLFQLLPKDYNIHCQVSLISLLKPADLRSARMVWAKRMDFVITDQSTKILLVIELDDASHQRKDRIKRDKFVNKALNNKHSLLRLTTDQAKDIYFVRRQLEKALS